MHSGKSDSPHPRIKNIYRIDVYPRSKEQRLVTAFAHSNEMSKSEAVTYILSKYFNEMPRAERELLHNHYEKMKPQQRKHPKSY